MKRNINKRFVFHQFPKGVSHAACKLIFNKQCSPQAMHSNLLGESSLALICIPWTKKNFFSLWRMPCFLMLDRNGFTFAAIITQPYVDLIEQFSIPTSDALVKCHDDLDKNVMFIIFATFHISRSRAF